MPELPEVETTRRGIAPGLVGNRVVDVVIRENRLRWPIPDELPLNLTGQTITAVDRRAKYLLLRTETGTALLHLGMSGSLCLTTDTALVNKHDHFDIVLENKTVLRFNDPRRFGCLLWTKDDPAVHPLLRNLGPEPLSPDFDGVYLQRTSTGRRIAIKPHLMNANIVVGVGNIYASEALHLAGIHPKRAAGRIAGSRLERLAEAIKKVLEESIRVGGTTLRDFYGGDGRPGYFRSELRVYGREGQPCKVCQTPIRQVVLGQRSTFYCVNCQH